jgi:hypothetical protein
MKRLWKAIVRWATRATAAALPADPTVYRRVVKRHYENLGAEIVTLDCGHAIELIRHRRQEYECPTCTERKAGASAGARASKVRVLTLPR